MIRKPPKYRVIIDTREQLPYHFFENEYCSGAVSEKLEEGDYTIKGAESRLAVERKKSSSEIAQNFIQDRFFREMQRLKDYRFKFIVCEFSYDDIMTFPKNSGIPSDKWHKIQITPAFLLKNINEVMLNYGVPFVFCGNRENGFKFTADLFKRTNQLLYEESGL